MATFLVGVFAAHYLGAQGLGLYAVGFSAFLFASMATTQSFFVPAEVVNLRRSDTDRVGLLQASLTRGLPIALGYALCVSLVVLVVPADLSRGQRIALVLTLMLTCAASPVQDHARRVFHQARRSWVAATTSLVQVVVVAAVLVVGLAANVSPFLLPFGALAAANTISLCVAWFASRSAPALGEELHPRRLFASGRWLLVGGAAQFGAGFIGTIMLATLVGAVYSGRTEAVRVLSQPLFVIAAGLGAVLGPRAMTAAQAKDRPGASLHTRRFLIVLGLVAVPYAFLIGFEWPWNPLVRLFPAAYQDNGLLLLMIVGLSVVYALTLHQAQLTAVGGQVVLAGASAAAAVTQVTVIALTLSWKSYSLVLGLLAAVTVRGIGLHLALRKHYRTPQAESPVSVPEA